MKQKLINFILNLLSVESDIERFRKEVMSIVSGMGYKDFYTSVDINLVGRVGTTSYVDEPDYRAYISIGDSKGESYTAKSFDKCIALVKEGMNYLPKPEEIPEPEPIDLDDLPF